MVMSLFYSLCHLVKTILHLHENVFHLQDHFHANQTYLDMKRFEHGLILKQKHKATWKYPIGLHMKLKTRTSM